jgi:hypothetical protein
MSDTIIVRRTGQAPLRVRGEVIATGESSFNNASPDYSGSTGRAQEVQVIKTASGKYVAAIHHVTQWQGEHNTDEAAVFPSLTQITKYLSDHVPGWMLQELVEQLGEEAVAEEVE